MRFPNPVTVSCPSCGQPTVLAETPTSTLWVHCGTWRWQCDRPGRRPRSDAGPGDRADDADGAASPTGRITVR